MNAEQIIGQIESIVASSGGFYRSWVVGVTDDPGRREEEHRKSGRYTLRWRQWDANSEHDAREVEAHFISQGMQGGTGGSGSADYVYIF